MPMRLPDSRRKRHSGIWTSLTIIVNNTTLTEAVNDAVFTLDSLRF